MSDGNRMVAVVVLSLTLASIVSACGGGDGGSCRKVAPCGGNVVGSWNVSGSCIDSSAFDVSACPGATVNVTITNVSGSVAFNNDLTYSITTTASLTLRETIPASCLQMSGSATTCAALDQQVQQQMATDPTVTYARCTGNEICTCVIASAAQTNAETGTYSTSGTTLTLLASDGTSDSSEYCLQGNELHVMELNPTMPTDATGQPNIEADTVLTRR